MVKIRSQVSMLFVNTYFNYKNIDRTWCALTWLNSRSVEGDCA